MQLCAAALRGDEKDISRIWNKYGMKTKLGNLGNLGQGDCPLRGYGAFRGFRVFVLPSEGAKDRRYPAGFHIFSQTAAEVYLI